MINFLRIFGWQR